jgi:hypothetical protein
MNGRIVLVFAWLATTVVAQPPAPPLPPSPQAPTLTSLFPLGGRVGQPVELTLTGTQLTDAIGLLLPFPVTVQFAGDGQKLTAKFTVPADAPLGTHPLRLITRTGVSNVRVFCVDELPEISDGPDQRRRSTALPVPVPVVVNGRVPSEASTFYKLTAQAGQRLTFEVLSRRLGQPLDPVVLLHDARTDRELAGVFSDDAPGLQSDSRLSYTCKAAGDYLLEVRDSTYRGGADYTYRLRIADVPTATSVLPAFAQIGSKTTFTFAGPPTAGLAPLTLAVPTERLALTPRVGNGPAGWPIAVGLSTHAELVEQEPNNTPEQAQRLTLPVGVTGQFLSRGDHDYFVFAARKGSKYVLDAQTAEIGSACEVYLLVTDTAGKELGKSNPEIGPRVEITAPIDGDVRVRAEHLNYAFGPNEVYRLTMRAVEPSVEVNLASDRVEAGPGGTAVLALAPFVRKGYDGPVEVAWGGPAAITGRVTIPAQHNPTVVLLPLRIDPAATGGAYTGRVEVRWSVNEQPRQQIASSRALLSLGLASVPYPPRAVLDQVAVAVTAPPPFTLSVAAPAPQKRGQPLTLTVSADRGPGADADIALSVVGVPANTTSKPAPIAKGATTSKLTLTPTPMTPAGPYALAIVGRTKIAGRDFAVSVPITVVWE